MKRLRNFPMWQVAVSATLLLVIVGFAFLASSLAALSTRADALRAELTQSQRDATTLAEQVEDLGGTPTVTPPTPGTGPTGPAGPMGMRGERGPGPTEAQILDAVRQVCAQTDLCEGPGPTTEAITAAVVAHFIEHPPSPGPSGPPGRPGADGADGAPGSDGKDGEDGRPPTEAEIRAVVEDFFDENDFFCTPPEDPNDRASGEPWRCSMDRPEESEEP